MRPQTINYEEWRRDAPRRRAQTERILALLGPIRRDRPRHPTEAAFLRRIGTTEHLKRSGAATSAPPTLPACAR